ncbi:hypothetical protein FSOLCH5_008822 [Fusarium solani]
MKKVYQAAIAIVGSWALSQVLLGIFVCQPIHGFWDKTVDAKCIPNQPQWYINAAGNIATDVMVFLLPIPAIRSLRLPRTQKFILAGIFSLGFFTVILSAIRIEYLEEFEDFTWKHVESNLWSMAELTSALICACLPTLRPFVVRYFPGLASKFTRSNEDLVAMWPADVINAAAVEPGSVRNVPIRGIKVKTETFQTVAKMDRERSL